MSESIREIHVPGIVSEEGDSDALDLSKFHFENDLDAIGFQVGHLLEEVKRLQLVESPGRAEKRERVLRHCYKDVVQSQKDVWKLLVSVQVEKRALTLEELGQVRVLRWKRKKLLKNIEKFGIQLERISEKRSIDLRLEAVAKKIEPFLVVFVPSADDAALSWAGLFRARIRDCQVACARLRGVVEEKLQIDNTNFSADLKPVQDEMTKIEEDLTAAIKAWRNKSAEISFSRKAVSSPSEEQLTNGALDPLTGPEQAVPIDWMPDEGPITISGPVILGEKGGSKPNISANQEDGFFGVKPFAAEIMKGFQEEVQELENRFNTVVPLLKSLVHESLQGILVSRSSEFISALEEVRAIFLEKSKNDPNRLPSLISVLKETVVYLEYLNEQVSKKMPRFRQK